MELLEENTGASFKNKLTRLRRGRHSASPPAASSSRRKTIVESSDDDLDQDDLDLPKVQDIQRIWDDDGPGQDEDDLDDMENFIDYEEDEEGAGAIGEDEKEERRKERIRLEKERRRVMGARPQLAGMDARQVASVTSCLLTLTTFFQRLGRNFRCIRRRS